MSSEIKITTEKRHFAEVVINGESKGKREINGGPSLLHFATELAREAGVRTFTVTLDEGDGPTPVSEERAKGRVPDGATVSVAAKNSRAAAKKDQPVQEPTSASAPAGEEASPAPAQEGTDEVKDAPADAPPAETTT